MQNSSHRSSILNAAFTLLALFGIGLAGLGIGLDFLPGFSPGLNLPQLLLILAGLMLALVSFRLRNAERRARFFQSAAKHLLPLAVISLITLLALELILTLLGIATYFPPAVPADWLKPAPWWTCDEAGCHYVYEQVQAACEAEVLAGRDCIVNRQGFHDRQDFVAGADFDERLRVLTLGDSFTFGLSAEIGKSYVETIESHLPPAIVWNTGIIGIGTQQALASFQVYAPLLQPQITILGFYTNDLKDNMLPMNSWLRVLDEDGKAIIIRQHRLDASGAMLQFDADTLYYRKHQVYPPASEIERLIGVTRLGTLMRRLVEVIAESAEGAAVSDWTLDASREPLRALRDAAAAQNSALLVLLIPHPDDLAAPSRLHRESLALLEELGIPHLNPIALLDAAGDYAPQPDIHWNDAGHQKIGRALSACLAVFQVRLDLSECEQVVMP